MSERLKVLFFSNLEYLSVVGADKAKRFGKNVVAMLIESFEIHPGTAWSEKTFVSLHSE